MAIVSALAAVGATVYARRLDKTAGAAVEATRQAAAAAKESAAAAGRSAIAAEAGMALETSRRHEELTPRFRVAVKRYSEFSYMTVFLLGPLELGRLAGLTVTIRDTDRFPIPERSDHPWTPEQRAELIFGPYRFSPGTATDAAGRMASHEGIQVRDELNFIMSPTSPPSWSGWEPGDWLEWVGTWLRLRLEARREGWEPWTLTCELDLAAEPAMVEVPEVS